MENPDPAHPQAGRASRKHVRMHFKYETVQDLGFGLVLLNCRRLEYLRARYPRHAKLSMRRSPSVPVFLSSQGISLLTSTEALLKGQSQ